MNLSPELIGPSVEFNDEVRHLFLRKLDDALNCTVSPTAWGCMWLADVSKLHSMLMRIQHFPDAIFDLRPTLKGVNLDMIVRLWSQRHRSKSTASSSRSTPSLHIKTSPAPPSPQQIIPSKDTTEDTSQLQQSLSVSGDPSSQGLKRKRISSESIPEISKRLREHRELRSATAREMCRRRDGSACIVTKFPDYIDVAHIFPFSMGRSEMETGTFWDLLQIFWSQERINGWRDAILRHGTETPENLMCFSPTLHRCHASGRFALQPIKMSEDEKQLTLRFYWLPRKSSLPAMNSIQDRPHIADNIAELPRDLKVFNVITERKICSGDEIVLETPDPKNLPLPDIRLLDMQWVLQRLMALSGGAEAEDYDLNDDDDDCVDPVGIESDESSQISENDYCGIERWISSGSQITVS